MRTAITILLGALAFWRAALDWQATIGAGYAYRFSSLGDLVGAVWPGFRSDLVGALSRSGLTWAWDPVGAFVLSLPVAPLLAAAAAAVWVTRARVRTRARW